jgi:matrixin
VYDSDINLDDKLKKYAEQKNHEIITKILESQTSAINKLEYLHSETIEDFKQKNLLALDELRLQHISQIARLEGKQDSWINSILEKQRSRKIERLNESRIFLEDLINADRLELEELLASQSENLKILKSAQLRVAEILKITYKKELDEMNSKKNVMPGLKPEEEGTEEDEPDFIKYIKKYHNDIVEDLRKNQLATLQRLRARQFDSLEKHRRQLSLTTTTEDREQQITVNELRIKQDDVLQGIRIKQEDIIQALRIKQESAIEELRLKQENAVNELRLKYESLIKEVSLTLRTESGETRYKEKTENMRQVLEKMDIITDQKVQKEKELTVEKERAAEIIEKGHKQTLHLTKKYYVMIAVFAIGTASLFIGYSAYENLLVIQTVNAIITNYKTGYFVQNQAGTLVNTWVAWNILPSRTLTVDIVNTAGVTNDKIEAIKQAVISEKILSIENNKVNKGPAGTSSTYYAGWVGALKKASENKTSRYIPVNFDVKEDPAGQGDIVITLTNDASPDGYTGLTRSVSDQHQILRSAITIYGTSNLRVEQVGAIVRHEFGHAMGLAHSNDTDDLMHATIETQYPYISGCDMNAISGLYNGKESSNVICQTLPNDAIITPVSQSNSSSHPLVTITQPTSPSQNSTVVMIPSWVKNNAKFWSQGSIDDKDYVASIQYLMRTGIMRVPPTSTNGSSQEIPTWVKNNAGQWATGQISDAQFVKGVQYLISVGLVQV